MNWYSQEVRDMLLKCIYTHTLYIIYKEYVCVHIQSYIKDSGFSSY